MRTRRRMVRRSNAGSASALAAPRPGQVPALNLSAVRAGRGTNVDVLALQRIVGNRAVSRLIQRDISLLPDFTERAKPSFFERSDPRLPALLKVYGEYEHVRNGTDEARAAKLRELNDKVTEILGSQKSKPGKTLAKALTALRAEIAPEVDKLQTRITDAKRAETINNSELGKALLTAELLAIEDPTERANALFDAFMAHGRKNFKYQTEKEPGSLVKDGAKKCNCEILSGTFLALLRHIGIADVTVKESGVKFFITKPLGDRFIDPEAKGNICAADGSELEGGPRYFFSDHWWVEGGGGRRFDPTAGVRGNLEELIEIRDLVPVPGGGPEDKQTPNGDLVLTKINGVYRVTKGALP